MSDRNAILEALIFMIHEIIDRVYDEDGTHRDMADEIAAAVLELVGPRELEWHQRDPQYWAAETVAGMCYILEYPGNAMPFKFDARNYSGHMSRHPTLESAQAAAQAHADAAHWANTKIGGK